MENQMHQIEMVTLEDLVPAEHIYRRISSHFPEEIIRSHLAELDHIKGADGYGIERLFKCLFLQFLEDFSDRELARFLQENTAAKWFCGFGLATKTPTFTLFGKIRKKIGTSRLSKLFSAIRDSLKSQGNISEIFTFVDASHLISKATLWKERDAVIKKKPINSTMKPSQK
jgi:transposase, IS5 family